MITRYERKETQRVNKLFRSYYQECSIRATIYRSLTTDEKFRLLREINGNKKTRSFNEVRQQDKKDV
jgi:hypothetical protein